MRNDISIPDYCYATNDDSDIDENDEYDPPDPLVNAWFGPRGTISSSHTDPYMNILYQVVGRIYIRLYNRSTETPRMFPMGLTEGGVDMSNTSGVEVGWVEGDEEYEEGFSGRSGIDS